MDNKRKHSATYDDARTKSKKSNSSTENTQGTSSAYLSDSHGVTLPTIVLDMANLQEQISGVPSAWFDSNAVGEVPTCNYSTNDIIRNYDLNDYYPDNELRTIMDDIDTTKYPNEFQYSDDELNTNSSDCSTIITSVSQQDNVYDYYQTENDEAINNSHLELKNNCSHTINGINDCGDGNKYYSDNVLRNADNLSTTKHINMFQACDDEINKLKTTCSYTINGMCNCDTPNKYYSDNELRTADNFSTTESTNMFQSGDDEINTARSESSTTITSISQQDNVYDYCQTKNDGEINNSSSKLTTCSYTTKGIECNSCEPNKYYSDNGDIIGTTKHSKTFHCHDDENINTASSKGTSIGTTVLTSVREQENRCFVYLSEYDEAMNEIRSEMYKIVKPAMTRNTEKPTSSFAVISSDQHLNGYSGECKQQPSTPSEHDNDSPLVLLCSGMQDHVLPNVLPIDDETSPKVFTEL